LLSAGTLKPQDCLLLANSAGSCANVRREQFCDLVELAAFFSYARSRSFGLRVCCLIRCFA
jgi:hypothetical protein